MQIDYAINRSIVNKAAEADYGRLTKNYETVTGDIFTLKDDLEHGWATASAVLADPKKGRNNANFLQSDLLFLDFDNSKIATNEEGQPLAEDGSVWVTGCNLKQLKQYSPDFTIEQALADPFIKDWAALVYTSPSHTEEWHKFRVVFGLPSTIEEPETYRSAVLWLQSKYPAADSSTKDLCRAWYGHKDGDFLIVRNIRLPDRYLDEIGQYHADRQAELDRQREAQRKYLEERAQDDPEDERRLLLDALKAIPPRAPGSNTYNESLSVLTAIKVIWGDTEGLAIAQGWSPTTDQQWDIEKKWDRLSTDSSNYGAWTIVGMASKKYGWKYPDWARKENKPKDKTLKKKTGEIVTVITSEETAEPIEGDEPGQPKPPDEVTVFDDVETLSIHLDALRDYYGYGTPNYRLAMKKLSIRTRISEKEINDLYYSHKNPQEESIVRNTIDVANEPEKPSDLWLFPDLMPQAWVTLFFAEGGSGKTRLCYQLMAAAARGETFLTEYRAAFPQKVLFIQVDENKEHSDRQIRDNPIMQHANIDVLNAWDSSKIDLLREMIVLNGYNLVVLDSLMAAQRNTGIEIKDPAFGDLIREFQSIASSTKASFVVLHHTNRAGEFTGNNSIKDGASCTWQLRKPVKEDNLHPIEESDRVLDIGGLKIRLGSKNKILVAFDENEDNFIYVDNFIKAQRDGQPASISDRLKLFFESNPQEDFSIEMLIHQPALSDIKQETLKKTCKRLKDRGILSCYVVESKKSTDLNKYYLSRRREQFPVPKLIEGEPVPALEPAQEPIVNIEQPPAVEPQKSRIGATDAETAESKSASRAPLGSYTGLPIGTTVIFSNRDLSSADLLKMRANGTELPWGTIGRIDDIQQDGNRYSAIVYTEKGSFAVRNLNAIVKYEG